MYTNKYLRDDCEVKIKTQLIEKFRNYTYVLLLLYVSEE